MSVDSPLIVHKDLYYSSENPLQKLDLYLPSPSNSTKIPPVVIIIHGGAWRSGDKSEFTKLGKGLSILGNCAVAIINYRLTTKDTPEIKDPIHVQDVATSIYWVSLHAKEYGYCDRIYLVGNSAGAFISGQLILNPEYLNFHDPNLLERIRGIIGIEGIYDIVSLLKSYPKYIEFVEPAFCNDENVLKSVSPQYMNASNTKIPPYLIIHSLEDELVDINQSDNYFKYLKNSGAEIVEIEKSLKGKHDQIMQTNELVQRIIEFIISLEYKASL